MTEPLGATIPPQARSKSLRACLLCSIIQTPADFRRHGCPNCDEILQVCSLAELLKRQVINADLDEVKSRTHSVVHDNAVRRRYRRY